MTELIKSLIQFQSEVGSIAKTKENLFFHSKYADLASYLSVCNPILHKHGLVITQTCEVDQGKTVLVTTLWHTGGQKLESKYILEPIKTDPQSMGSAFTYARRYCLSAILGITAEEDDDGNTATRGSSNQQQQKQSVPSNGNGNGKTKELGLCPVCKKPKLMADRYSEGVKYCLGCGKKFDSNMKEIVKVSQTNEQQTFDHDGFPEHNPDPTEKYPF